MKATRGEVQRFALPQQKKSVRNGNSFFSAAPLTASKDLAAIKKASGFDVPMLFNLSLRIINSLDLPGDVIDEHIIVKSC